MINRVIIIIIHLVCLSGQTLTDKPLETCNKQRSLARWASSQSSITENQEKIDIGYYHINIEIDIENQEIVGSVLVNGSVGIEQPDSIELDLASELVVDSIVSYGETLSFVHDNDMIKVPTQPSIPEGYDFSLEVFYHGRPPSTGFGSFNFDEPLTIFP